METPMLDKMMQCRNERHSELLGSYVEWMRTVDTLNEYGCSTWDGEVSRATIVNSVKRIYQEVVLGKPDVSPSAQPEVDRFVEWYDDQDYIMRAQPINRILSEYFGIDESQAEEERRQILENIRKDAS